MAVARGLRHLPGVVFLDSSSSDEGQFIRPDARLSLVAARPRRILKGALGNERDRAALQEGLDRAARGLGACPDFGFPCGGWIGAVDYSGDFTFGFYPEILLYDHGTRQWREFGNLSREIDWRRAGAEVTAARPASELAFDVRTGRAEYCAMVGRAREYIAAGDIYQVNLSRRYAGDWPAAADPFSLYERLRESSPAPFAAFLDLGERQVLSSSPELFLRLSGNAVRTRPIKGTRPRFSDRAKDEKSAYDLITSPKEIAELIMITDLERNDLGQFCEFGSVQATDLLRLERFEQVFHLVSTVEGQMREGVTHVRALAECFPGGSITGAPKKRAREIIAELEPEPRGLYTGAIGILGINGESRFSIAIRTAVVERGVIHFHSGAGIVADSVPEREYEETLHKAGGILAACGRGG